MTWMERKSISVDLLRSLCDEFNEKLKEKYSQLEIDVNGINTKVFRHNNGDVFSPGFMFGGTDNCFHCLVIKYAGDIEEFQQYLEEEGGQFFPEDYESKEEMFKAMLDEIEK